MRAGEVLRRADDRRVRSHHGRTRSPLRDWVEKAFDVPGIRLAPLDAATAAESTLLPGEPLGDPADCFLIAAARTLGVALATSDERIIEYSKFGFLRIVKL